MVGKEVFEYIQYRNKNIFIYVLPAVLDLTVAGVVE